MQSIYHLEFVSRETVAERLGQAERDAVARRARRAKQQATTAEAQRSSGWLALPRALGAIGRRLGRGVTPSAVG